MFYVILFHRLHALRVIKWEKIPFLLKYFIFFSFVYTCCGFELTPPNTCWDLESLIGSDFLKFSVSKCYGNRFRLVCAVDKLSRIHIYNIILGKTHMNVKGSTTLTNFYKEIQARTRKKQKFSNLLNYLLENVNLCWLFDINNDFQKEHHVWFEYDSFTSSTCNTYYFESR